MISERFISAQDGLKLYVKLYEPLHPIATVICLAGLTRNSRDFESLALWLYDKGYKVVCSDYRGRGRSDYDPIWQNYTPQTYGGDIFALCTALQVHQAIFIGTSLGGLLSMGLSVLAPTLVKAVVLNDVGPELSQQGLDQIIAYTADGQPLPDWIAAVEKIKAYYPNERDKPLDVWMDVLSTTYNQTAQGLVPAWDPMIARSLTAQGQHRSMDLWPFFYALGKRPVCLLRGAESSVFRADVFERMLKGLPNISGYTIENVGHAPTLKEPSVRSALETFLKKML